MTLSVAKTVVSRSAMVGRQKAGISAAVRRKVAPGCLVMEGVKRRLVSSTASRPSPAWIQRLWPSLVCWSWMCSSLPRDAEQGGGETQYTLLLTHELSLVHAPKSLIQPTVPKLVAAVDYRWQLTTLFSSRRQEMCNIAAKHRVQLLLI